ncbi:hypothetical protein Mal4_29510 [Maioricimonas rarisocia]|uniref:Uncharacterized protein n=1 Tax=Maioricimonas rarisocia TaxID=2528026 RepID=A0A517Z806_9PLAN|nr:hypothetical protein [Maioricimonas rarisocia]QDU38622.1 hypothetical protein Mal4_29510 [Maioricimonas rarisocia]
MSSLFEQLQAFTEYARSRIDAGAKPESIDELFDEWRESELSSVDAHAVAASLRDMEQGETGRSLEEFRKDFSREKGLSQND